MLSVAAARDDDAPAELARADGLLSSGNHFLTHCRAARRSVSRSWKLRIIALEGQRDAWRTAGLVPAIVQAATR